MKVLIISNPKTDRVQIAAARYSKMVDLLRSAEMEAHSEIVQNQQQLNETIKSVNPDIIYCAQDNISNDSLASFRVHAFLDKIGIPYIGSTSDTLALVLSKSKLKQKWKMDGVSTPSFLVLNKDDIAQNSETTLLELEDYPYILKPDSEGNSRGLDESSVVFDQPTLMKKIKSLLEVYDSILVEKYLGNYAEMQEFTLAMIGNGTNCLIMPAEITLKQKKRIRIITTTDKDNPNTSARPVLDPNLRNRLIEFSTKAFQSSGVRDYARCDVIMANDRIYAIEINGQPMIPDKWFEMCAKGSGLSAVQYVCAILLAGIVRNNRSSHHQVCEPDPIQRLLPSEIYSKLSNKG